MNRLCTIIWLLFCSSALLAQNLSTISGSVQDDENGEALPLVTILVKDANDQFATGTSTDENGQFEIKVAPGK